MFLGGALGQQSNEEANNTKGDEVTLSSNHSLVC
jgi:hypothetical protein